MSFARVPNKDKEAVLYSVKASSLVILSCFCILVTIGNSVEETDGDIVLNSIIILKE